MNQPDADRQVTIAGSPITISETEPTPGGRAPLLDEHRAELLGAESSDAEGRQTAESDD